MKTLFSILVISILISASNTTIISRDSPHIRETDTPPCATDSSGAFIDLIVLIDTSANMGSTNVRKIANILNLALASFPIGNQWDITLGQKNTRVSVITYDQQATIIANYTQINQLNDLTNVVNGIQVSTSQTANLYDGLLKAFYMDTNCTDPFNCSVCYGDRRPTAFLLFAASSNTPNMSELVNLVGLADFFDDGTFVTINFNTADSKLNSLLQLFTLNRFINATMYNFKSSSNTITRDVTWALTQVNCYCGDLGGVQNVYYDSTNSRYARSRECFYLDEWGGQYPNDTIDMCSWPGLQIVPGFFLTASKTNFAQNIYSNYYPFYIGLHQNSQNQWVWYDYNRNEFPVGNYTDWADGNPSSGGCAVMDSDDGTNFVWKSYGCNTEATGLNLVFCQKLACDTTSFACCADCNGGSTESCTFGWFERKNNRRLNKNKKYNV